MNKLHTSRRGMTLALLLATALGAPASTLALPTDAPAAELETPRLADTPTVSSVWDQPATPPPVENPVFTGWDVLQITGLGVLTLFLVEFLTVIGAKIFV